MCRKHWNLQCFLSMSLHVFNTTLGKWYTPSLSGRPWGGGYHIYIYVIMSDFGISRTWILFGEGETPAKHIWHYPPWNEPLATEHRPGPKRKGSSSNHPFFGRVTPLATETVLVSPPRSLVLRQLQSFAELGVEGLFAGNHGCGKRHGQRNGLLNEIEVVFSLVFHILLNTLWGSFLNPRRPSHKVFGGVQTPTHKVFGRLGFWRFWLVIYVFTIINLFICLSS